MKLGCLSYLISGKTPIQNAVKFGKFEMIKFLIHADCQYDEELINSERMKYLCSVVPVFGSWSGVN
jgi:hypothetical protein